MSEASAYRHVETKLPLWWLIATAGAVVFTMGSTVANFNTVEMNLDKIEKKVDSLDSKVHTVSTQLTIIEGRNELQDVKIDYLNLKLPGLSLNGRPQE